MYVDTCLVYTAGHWQAYQDARLHCVRLLPNCGSAVSEGGCTGQYRNWWQPLSAICFVQVQTMSLHQMQSAICPVQVQHISGHQCSVSHFNLSCARETHIAFISRVCDMITCAICQQSCSLHGTRLLLHWAQCVMPCSYVTAVAQGGQDPLC